MQLIINNLTGSTRTYLSGAVSVAGNGSTTVTNTAYQLQLSLDGGLRSDIFSNNASIGDGTNTFGVQDAINYLYQLLQYIGPNADAAGNGITSTTVSSKQALDVNVAATAPPSNILATGTLTGLSQSVVLTLQGTASINVDVSGSGFVGTITVTETTPSSARTLGLFALNSSAAAASITANGNYRVVGIPTSGTVTVAFTAYTSGSATINIYGSTAPYIVQPYSANAANVLITSYVNDGSGNAITSTTINSKQRLDVNSSTEGPANSTAPYGTVQTGGLDPTGKLQAFKTLASGELFVRDVINVSGQNRAQSVTTTAAEALGGSTILVNRKVLNILPTNGTVYWGYTSGVTTTTGTPIFKNQNYPIAVTDNVHIYLISAGTVDCRISEGS